MGMDVVACRVGARRLCGQTWVDPAAFARSPGVWPMAKNRPSVASSLSAPVTVSRSVRPVSFFPLPSTASMVAFHTGSMFLLASTLQAYGERVGGRTRRQRYW